MTDELYERLTAIQKQRRKIKEAQEDLEIMFQSMVSPAAMRYDKDKVQSSPTDPMLNYAVRVEEQEDKIQKLKADLPRVTQETVSFIRRTSKAEYATALIGIYVRQRNREQLAKEMNYSVDSIFRFRRQGIRELEQILTEEKDASACKSKE